MSEPQLVQLEMLARLDELMARSTDWQARPSVWQPMRQAQALARRALERVETLRIRLEAPIVVATFGGTGTGKSTLVNALVGEECTPSGRERPTTRRPVLLAHPKTQLEALGLPLADFDIVRSDAELLRDIVLIDCPDPDTSEDDASGSNLERLHALLPFCDVLIYVSTQQKYRSARVADELGQAASGCRLVFVQTHADLDEDVREDWRRMLRTQYEIPDVFFVDSLRGLRDQQAGHRPGGELARLQDLLTTQLAASERVRIRRANVIDLLCAAFRRCGDLLSRRIPDLARLEAALARQQELLGRRLAGKLQHELLGSRHLWERRLLSAVSDSWGFSPFSALLRVYHGLGALITSVTLFRARSAAQMALVGAVQGTRWWLSRRDEQSADEKLESVFCLDDALLRESELVVQGHLREAGLQTGDAGGHSLSQLRNHAAVVEHEFLGDAGRRISEIIERLAARNSRWHVRLLYETAWVAYLAFVLYRVGRNFFIDSWLQDARLLESGFYLPAALFLILWGAMLLMSFTRRLRRGLSTEINALAGDLVRRQLATGLFPEIESGCREARLATSELEALLIEAEQLQGDLASSPALGTTRPRPTLRAEPSLAPTA